MKDFLDKIRPEREDFERIIPYKKAFFVIGTLMVVVATPIFYPNNITLWGIFIGFGMLLDVVGVLLTEKSVRFAKHDIYDARDEITDIKDDIYYEFDTEGDFKSVQRRLKELEEIHNKRF